MKLTLKKADNNFDQGNIYTENFSFYYGSNIDLNFSIFFVNPITFFVYILLDDNAEFSIMTIGDVAGKYGRKYEITPR